MAQQWTELNLPILTVAAPIEIWLEHSRRGLLCLTARKQGFPVGELSLIISNWPQTRHWIVPARQEGETLRADVRGSEDAFDPEDERPLLLSLAVRRDRGVVRYPLRAIRLNKKMQDRRRCLFLHDERSWFAGPVDTYCRQEQVYEVLPRYVVTGNGSVALGLWSVPRSLRYWEQLRYGLTEFEVRGSFLRCAAAAPHGGPEVRGFSLHLQDGREQGQRFFPLGEDGTALIPLTALPLDDGVWRLSAVCQQEGGILYHVPLSVLEPELHERMMPLCNGIPLRRAGDLCCWLSLDELCGPVLRTHWRRPDGQAPIPGLTLAEAVMTDTLPIQGMYGVRDLGGRDWHLRLELPELSLAGATSVRMLAAFRLERCLLPVDVTEQGSGCILDIDLNPVLERIQNSRLVRWQLSLTFCMDELWFHVYLRCPARMVRRNLDVDPEFLDYTRCFGAPVGTAPLGESDLSCVLNCAALGRLRLQIQDRVRTFEQQIICRVNEIELEGKTLTMSIRCPNDVPGRWCGIVLNHRYKLEADRLIYYVPARRLRVEEDITGMEVSCELDQFHFTPLYWDIRAVFEAEDGMRYHVRAIAPRKKVKRTPMQRRLRRLRRLLHANSYRQSKDWSVSLYKTAKFGYALVCQEYSPYSGIRFRLKERLALAIHKLFRKPLAKKSIFLVYEKYCCMAQDNGFYFFKYCMDNDMERVMGRSIYFVIDKRQPDYKERLLPYRSHVIQFMSLKHMIYLLAARLLISSDSKAHAYAWRAKESVILPRIEKRKKLVFLQHGVIALKRVEFYSKGTNAVQLFITSNQREHDIIVREMAYPDEDVVITGLARWDVLEDKGLRERHILVMPTWRNWLEEVSDTAFMTSDYYRSYMALLNDARMGALLERYDLYLDFYIHPKFRDYISNFSIGAGGRVRLIPFGAEPLNQLIMGCKLLITDYSSVCWDVYYQGKPVLFYQFDVEQYNETTGSYIDMETELFGDRAMTPEELLGLLEQYAKDDFALPPKYAELRPKMYSYIDHNNSRRTCEEIMKRHW